MLIIKDFDATEPPPEVHESPSTVAANFTGVWNAATQAGILSKNDAAILLSIVQQAPKSKPRKAIEAALAAVLSASEDGSPVPDDLFPAASAWLASIG